MNPARLKAFITSHKGPLAAAGAVVVVIAALYARKRSTTAAAGSTTTGTVSSSTSGAGSAGTYSAYGQTVPYTPYDSSATDTYNALQPQIEALQELVKQIPVSAAPTTSTPIATPVVDTTPQGYYRRTGTQAVYRANADGTLTWLDRAAYDGASDPAYKDVAASDPLWNRKVVGTDAPAQFRS